MLRAAMPATSCCRAGSPSRRRRRSSASSPSATCSRGARRRRPPTTPARSRARVEAIELRFDVNAGPTGSLFGSVTATNVADRLWEQEKIRVDRRKLSMDTIKRVGRYTVPVELFADVVAELKLAVAPEGQELPTEVELAEAEAEAQAAEAAVADAAAAETAVAEAAVEAAAAAEDGLEPRDRAEPRVRRRTRARSRT